MAPAADALHAWRWPPAGEAFRVSGKEKGMMNHESPSSALQARQAAARCKQHARPKYIGIPTCKAGRPTRYRGIILQL